MSTYTGRARLSAWELYLEACEETGETPDLGGFADWEDRERDAYEDRQAEYRD